MGFAEKRGEYWRGRYKVERGRYATVKDESGAVARFRTRREAEQAANDAEAKVRAGGWRNPSAGLTPFGEYANAWYERQDLAASTMQKLPTPARRAPVARVRVTQAGRDFRL
jgi:hypothetical protein